MEGQGLKSTTIKSIDSLTKDLAEEYDTIFLEKFLTEKELLEVYAMANAVLITPRNREQISSGILADTIGSRRVAIATKFTHAVELLHGHESRENMRSNGIVGIDDSYNARGILVDLGGNGKDVPNTDQIAQGLDYLIFNDEPRLRMEENAGRRGSHMKEELVAWNLVKHISTILEGNAVKVGRGKKFVRSKNPFNQ